VNLALSIALEQDKTVLLVDADVLKPSVSKTLDIGSNVGLIEYLLGEEEDVSKIIYRTNVENLRVLPAGLPHHLSNELLSSQKMMTLIEEFASRYPDRVVVFDAPPLLGVNETSVMAEQCGQGVVVVEEHKSKLSDVQTAVELLPENMAVGFVLNKSISQDPEHGYGYGYGYYYGAKRPEKKDKE
jgi:receptor protein-tyrosine kinase